ncbi:MAG: RNA polymerase sigma factor [Deltaproteobacteria bacterium]|nr:RNA polymerase sigma factor [Deltaproteobacteria bacterium]
MSSPQAIAASIEAVFRIESAKLIATLARVVRDVGRAEELAQDALVAALEQWPTTGVPQNPGAWLMATAKHRAIDSLRHHAMAARKHEEIGHDPDQSAVTPDVEEALDDDVGDDLLRLIFTACHPVLSPEGRAALTLRLVGGLTTQEIARAYLCAEPTIAQRIVRAKRTLQEANVPFELPRGPERLSRLASVLEVIYLIFNEGYSATTGEDLIRPGLCEDALRVGRILAELAPEESEVHGLVALMEIQASRTGARVSPSGEPVLLLDQNRALWDRVLIGRGFAALRRALEVSATPGPYVVQAMIAACHARAAAPEQTDWQQIADLYGTLHSLLPTPVVELNRAVAVAMAQGPAEGLVIADALEQSGALEGYHLLPSVRADFLFKLGRTQEAAAEFLRAASMARNTKEQTLLRKRAESCS